MIVLSPSVANCRTFRSGIGSGTDLTTTVAQCRTTVANSRSCCLSAYNHKNIWLPSGKVSHESATVGDIFAGSRGTPPEQQAEGTKKPRTGRGFAGLGGVGGRGARLQRYPFRTLNATPFGETGQPTIAEEGPDLMENEEIDRDDVAADVPLRNAMLTWNIGGDALVVEHPDAEFVSASYSRSVGACFNDPLARGGDYDWPRLTDDRRLAVLLGWAFQAVARDGVNPADMERALAVIPEYRSLSAGR
jgi:hypothetical protein